MTYEEHLRELWGEDFDSIVYDIERHGCEGGVPGLIYYSDTIAMHDAHEEEIWDALYEDAESNGVTVLALLASFGFAKHVNSLGQLKNLLAWYMAERVAGTERISA